MTSYNLLNTLIRMYSLMSFYLFLSELNNTSHIHITHLTEHYIM
jgi:hypothetical protein